jgi:hypothetical protein
MFHVKLYRECDVGGAYSGSTPDPKKTKGYTTPLPDSNYLDSFASQPLIPDPFWLQEQSQNIDLGPYGPNLYKKTTPKHRVPQKFPQKSIPDPYKDMMELLQKKNSTPSYSFEMMINTLFSLEEKKEFLLSMGYTMDSYGKFYKEDSKAPNGELESLFMFEIIIKFKNLLLSKGTLKLKL